MTTQKRPKGFSPDLYYEDADGKKHDAEMHAEMLEDNPEADKAFQNEAVRIARSLGWSEERITAAFRNSGK